MSFSESNCAETIREMPFYVYGEVSSDTEERIEAHLEDCAACTRELALHKSFLKAVDRREDLSDSTLLTSARMDLRRALKAEARPAKATFGSWLEKLSGISRMHIPFRIPVGAMALVLLGWLGARYAPERFGGVRAGIAEPMFSSIKSVSPDSTGHIQIAVDDVQRHVVTGTLQDPRIQALLLSAAREESNPGVRVDSIGALQNSAGSQEVRTALIDAVSHDPNASVRLKAINALKQYGSDATVRKALANVLLKDEDPGIRLQAIDLLSTHNDDSIVGVLQDVVQKDDNSYIRTRCRNLLESMKASVGTY
jgi:anti-sigma factor RsiW